MEEVLIFLQEQVFIAVALAILIIAFLRKESAEGGTKLSISQVVQAMNNDVAVLLDVRDTKEYNQGHIANAIHIAHTQIQKSLNKLEKHREKQIIVADAMGQHAGTVGRLLAKEGFKVARVEGGMAEWKQEGLPLVK